MAGCDHQIRNRVTLVSDQPWVIEEAKPCYFDEEYSESRPPALKVCHETKWTCSGITVHSVRTQSNCRSTAFIRSASPGNSSDCDYSYASLHHTVSSVMRSSNGGAS